MSLNNKANVITIMMHQTCIALFLDAQRLFTNSLIHSLSQSHTGRFFLTDEITKSDEDMSFSFCLWTSCT